MTVAKTIARFSHGTIRVTFDQLAVCCWSVMMLLARTRPRAVPTRMRCHRDDRRLEQEARLHGAAPEADRPQDADVLPALDHRTGADDPERGDADDQAEAHECEDQAVEGQRCGGRRRAPRRGSTGHPCRSQERSLESAAT